MTHWPFLSLYTLRLLRPSVCCLQFRGLVPAVHGIHFGAHCTLGVSSSAPCQTAEPPAAPDPPAPSAAQRPPCHLTEPGAVTQQLRGRRGAAGGCKAGGKGQPSRTRGISLQSGRRGTVPLQPGQLGSHDGANTNQGHGRQIFPVSTREELPL